MTGSGRFLCFRLKEIFFVVLFFSGSKINLRLQKWTETILTGIQNSGSCVCFGLKGHRHSSRWERERETERDGEVGRRERKEGEPGGELGCIFCPLPPKDWWWFQPTTGAICILILVMVSTEAMWGLGIFWEPAMLGELALWEVLLSSRWTHQWQI